MILSNLTLPPELLAAEKYAYAPSNIKITNLEQEQESQEYGALRFQIDNLKILFRSAKITPTKNGQFVTIWKRINNSPIMPFDVNDPIDLVIIGVHQGGQHNRWGQFVFPKSILLEKKIFSHNNQGGKRAIRVYPPWDQAENRQAQATQHWQLVYFFEFGPHRKPDPQKINLLIKNS